MKANYNALTKEFRNADIYELQARYDSRHSFYGKRFVIEYPDGSKDLMSYTTIVSHCDQFGNVEHFGKWSQTTSRHQREFEKQFSKH